DGTYDGNAQPYREVKPGDVDENGIYAYPEATAAAQARLEAYHASVRYNYCEDVLSTDIFDPLPVFAGAYHPSPSGSGFPGFLLGSEPPTDPFHPTDYIQPPIGVPYHSHWFSYD